ncbi:MAG: hypothetical protein M0Z85_11450 [Gammaproteobacteria bacterium]|nr:hypothetical protein [Gammaproteobacteria bacterium]
MTTTGNRLYIGSRALRPEGYKTVDIDPANNPDYLADLCDMAVIPNASCQDIIASHVLEHVEWPNGFKALAEMARVLSLGGVLRLAVPDMASLAYMLARGESPFSVMGHVYGGIGLNNSFENHRFGYTAQMLIDILSVLGMGNFSWWNSTRREAANGWDYGMHGAKLGVSLNVAAIKQSSPFVSPQVLYEKLQATPTADFLTSVSEVATTELPTPSGSAQASYLYQNIHFQLIDARQRIQLLETELSAISRPNDKKTGWRRIFFRG